MSPRGSLRASRARRVAILLAASVAASLGAGVAAPRAVHADGPGVGAPWVVTVGDSYISGEAGRWAGNTNMGEQYIDALGPTAYFDNASGTGEQIARCHRSWAAEVYFGDANGLNLACSGAKTATFTDSSGNFKPGIDFYSDSSGNEGQALMLEQFATSNNVGMVVLSIGGNDFNFGTIVATCVADWASSPSWWPHYCKNDSSVKNNFTSSNVTAVTSRIAGAIQNIHAAMSAAGYSNSQYTIAVQNYPDPIPNGSGFRYSQSGYTRQSTGGCGFWNADADWANATALPTINSAVRNAVSRSGVGNVVQLNIASAFNGRRLCENTVGLIEEKGLSDWTDYNAQDVSEWINQIRTASTYNSDYYIQESLHPNYWGQLALRNCLRQAWNGGSPRGGTCTIAATGTDWQGEPLMALR